MKYEDSHMDNRWDRRDRKRRSKKSFVQDNRKSVRNLNSMAGEKYQEILEKKKERDG